MYVRPAPELVEGLDGAPLAHPGPVVDVLRHRSWRQGLQMRAFLLQLPQHQPVAPVNHLPGEAGAVVGRVELTAAPQHQSLVDGVLEPVVGLLGHAVFVGLAGIDQGGLETVAVQQGPASAAALLMSCGGGIVAAHHLGTPPWVHRGFCNPCCRARKVSPATTSA